MDKRREITEWMLAHCQNCSVFETQEKMERGKLPVQKVDDDAGYKTISSEKCSLCGEFIGDKENMFELTMNKVKKVDDPVTGESETHASDVETLAILCGDACKEKISDIIMACLEFPEVAVEEKEEEKEDWQG